MENEVTKEAGKGFEEMMVPYAEKALNLIEQGAEFMGDQIPVIIQQFIIYESVTSGLMILFSLFLMYLPFLSYSKLVHEPELRNLGSCYVFNKKVRDGYAIVWWVVSIISSVLGITFFFANMGIFIKATFLPHLFIFETFVKLVN